MLPFWLALSASLMLHAVVLVAPGWALPFDDEPTGHTLDATLVVPAMHKEEIAQVIPPVPPQKPVRKRWTAPPVPVSPMAPIPDAPAAVLPAEPHQENVEAPAETATTSAPPAEDAHAAVPSAPTISTIPYTGNWPKYGRIVFQVSRGDGFVVGQSKHHWSHDGSTYRLSTLTETTGLAALFRSVSVEQESRGALSAAGMQPLEFKTMRNGKPKDSARFDLEQHIVMTANGERMAITGSTQDMLSVFYQLAMLPLDKPQITLKLMTGRKVADYTVSVDAPSEIETFNGKRNALHLTIVVAGGGKSEDSTELWLDAATRLPLKIRHRDRKGEVFDQVVTAIELDTPQ